MEPQENWEPIEPIEPVPDQVTEAAIESLRDETTEQFQVFYCKSSGIKGWRK